MATRNATSTPDGARITRELYTAAGARTIIAGALAESARTDLERARRDSEAPPLELEQSTRREPLHVGLCIIVGAALAGMLILAMLLTAPRAGAHSLELEQPGPFDFTAVGVNLSPATYPSEWLAEGERIARAFTVALGYQDACQAPRQLSVVVATNLATIKPHAGGIAWVNPGYAAPCAIAIAETRLAARCAFLDIYVHERLHAARNDGFHSSQDGHPLGRGYTPPACGEPEDPTAGEKVSHRVTMREARAHVIAHLGPGTRAEVCGGERAAVGFSAVFICAARREGRRIVRPTYRVTRPTTYRLKLERSGTWI